jgi:hypothetical protein
MQAGELRARIVTIVTQPMLDSGCDDYDRGLIGGQWRECYHVPLLEEGRTAQAANGGVMNHAAPGGARTR